MRLRLSAALLLLFVVIVCAGGLHAQTETPVPTEEASPTPLPINLKLWLPDLLVAPDNTDARDELDRQIESAIAAMPGVTVDIRQKRVGDVGGIMSALRAASSVAPNAQPDITLLRRQDLVSAARDGLIQSLEGKIPAANLVELDGALKLGQVNNGLFGIPYMLDLQHTVYRVPEDSELDYSNWNYTALLERKEPLVFAAGKPTGINDVVYLQYLAAGGTLSGEGRLVLNIGAVESTLDFYEAATEDGIVNPTVLNYIDPADYLTAFIDGDINSAVMSSTTYLRLLRDEPDLQAAAIPAENGTEASLLNGWVWVVVTSDPVRQERALQLIGVLMQPDNQLAVAQAVDMLPSVHEVMIESLDSEANQTLYSTLLENAVLPLTEGDGGILARSLQDAFAAVINGTKTASEAAEGIQTE